MHIAILPSSYPSPENPVAGIFFKEQAEALRKAGHQVGVLHFSMPTLKSVLKEKKLPPLGIRDESQAGMTVYCYKGIAFLHYGPLNTYLYCAAMRKLFHHYLLEKGRPAIIHAHCAYPAGIIARHISKRFNVPYAVTEHSSAFITDRIERWQTPLIEKCFRDADMRIAVSPALEKTLKKRFNLPFTVIPNMVDTLFFSPRDTENNAAKAQQPPFTFLCIALLTRTKGVDVLLKAFARTFKNTDTKLLIGGDGEERGALEQLAAELGIEAQTRFLGLLTRQQVRDMLRSCHTFVLPSRHETFGIAVIEAFACGVPVIATRCGGPDCLVNKTNGFLVPAGNETELSHAMQQMYNEYHRFNPQVIRQECISRFGEETVVNHLKKTYQSICERQQ